MTETVNILAPGDHLEDAFAVRRTVFVEEQKFDPHRDVDEIDPIAYHVVFYRDGVPFATGRTFPGEEPGVWIIGRVAVVREFRGGSGRRLMAALEQVAAERGASRAELGAQRQAQDFYARLGYQEFGEEYMDEHCPHIPMKKWL